MKKVFLVLLAVLVLCSTMMIPAAAASSNGEISTDKAEYLEGELIKVSYKFDSEDTTRKRRINIYKDSVSDDNFVWAVSASGVEGFGHHIYFWSLPEGVALLSEPGNYVMKVVMGFNGDYGKEITSTFTVKENPNLVRTPSISLASKENSLDDMLEIRFNGITDSILHIDSTTGIAYNLKIAIYDSLDFPVAQILLWNGTEYKGISGTLEFDPVELWADEFYMVLESDDPTLNLANTRFDFSIVEPEVPTITPETTPDATIDTTPEATPETTPEATPDETTGTVASEAPTAGNAGNSGSGNATLWIVVGVAGVLIVALAVVVVILLKKKK